MNAVDRLSMAFWLVKQSNAAWRTAANLPKLLSRQMSGPLADRALRPLATNAAGDVSRIEALSVAKSKLGLGPLKINDSYKELANNQAGHLFRGFNGADTIYSGTFSPNWAHAGARLQTGESFADRAIRTARNATRTSGLASRPPRGNPFEMSTTAVVQQAPRQRMYNGSVIESMVDSSGAVGSLDGLALSRLTPEARAAAIAQRHQDFLAQSPAHLRQMARLNYGQYETAIRPKRNPLQGFVFKSNHPHLDEGMYVPTSNPGALAPIKAQLQSTLPKQATLKQLIMDNILPVERQAMTRLVKALNYRRMMDRLASQAPKVPPALPDVQASPEEIAKGFQEIRSKIANLSTTPKSTSISPMNAVTKLQLALLFKQADFTSSEDGHCPNVEAMLKGISKVPTAAKGNDTTTEEKVAAMDKEADHHEQETKAKRRRRAAVLLPALGLGAYGAMMGGSLGAQQHAAGSGALAGGLAGAGAGATAGGIRLLLSKYLGLDPYTGVQDHMKVAYVKDPQGISDGIGNISELKKLVDMAAANPEKLKPAEDVLQNQAMTVPFGVARGAAGAAGGAILGNLVSRLATGPIDPQGSEETARKIRRKRTLGAGVGGALGLFLASRKDLNPHILDSLRQRFAV